MKTFSGTGWSRHPTIDTSKYGIRIRSQPAFTFPEGHVCYGCVFVSGIGRGLAPPCQDRQTCSFALYQRLSSHRGEKE